LKVLLVEDDMQVAEPLVENLRRYEHDVEHVVTGIEAVTHPEVDLVLVDLGLPDLDGLEVCRRLRQSSDVPIIVISARSEESDRVLALHVGADDYLIKPFGIRELIARMEAVSRRYRSASDHRLPMPRASEDQARGQLRVDPRSRQVSAFGEPVRLTRKQFDLLALLMEDWGAVVRREVIINRVWDGPWFGSTRTVDSHVSVLRRKLLGAVVIETVRGVGFRLADRASGDREG
jgi:DNA-binding response OmpR family regulator